MFRYRGIQGSKGMLLALVVASSIGVLGASDKLSDAAIQSAVPVAQPPMPTSKPTTPPQSPATKPSAAAQPFAPAEKAATVGVPKRHVPTLSSNSANQYYSLIWGVDSFSVKYAESGEIIRFKYRVLDQAKAAPLNDKKNEPSLIDPGAGVKLVIPSMEKIGKLRQSSTPQAGKAYWMAFSNKGRLVKPGHRVNIVIGPFRVDGLAVE